jgi:Cu(I)/Ag(I) efflux system membrane fusion protein
MHPSVKKDVPGSCPICGMPLTPVTHAELHAGAVVLDAQRRQAIGVRTAGVARRALTKTIRAAAHVTIDESSVHDVTLRVGGYVQSLLANKPEQEVRRGQTLLTLYSPELYAAGREHLAARTAATMQRLVQLGQSQSQVQRLEQGALPLDQIPVYAPVSGFLWQKNVVEGAYVPAGQPLFRIASLERTWVLADVFEADVTMLRAGMATRVAMNGAGSFAVPIDSVYPTVLEQTRTGRIRIVADGHGLRPGMYGTVEIDLPLGERLAVPESAVIYTGERRLVFADVGEGRLVPTPVTVGARAGEHLEVLSGLAEGDVVVTSGNFLIAAESRIRSATTAWGDAHAGH